jgi:RNA polymerase-binding transcription factor
LNLHKVNQKDGQEEKESHGAKMGWRLTLPPERFRILTAHKSFREKMVGKSKKSKSSSLVPAKTIKPEVKIEAARKMLLDMKEKLLAEGLGKCLPEDLARPFDIGDEGDRADTERTDEVSILISARDKEKLVAIEEALEKIREGTYGVCEDCGDEIGSGRLKAMPLAKLCVTCQSRLEKETAHQKFAEEGMRNQPLMGEAEGEETD